MGENKEGENWQSNPSLSGIDPDETDLILQVLMQRMSAEERSKIDMVRMLSRMIGQKK